ncbi:matrixin family metalloprotease [Nocardioides yefusunii]|uniref:Matrixin family metalloprotease n=1 Tax=Nocardioides yefusunii TaxID=2500546 RepID=A0ABW1R0T0_9ACTN|nr:matrixin family metalloprotease [Nocardioides yefusunii]
MPLRPVRSALAGSAALATSVACLALAPAPALGAGTTSSRATASTVSVKLDRATAKIGTKVVLRGSVKGASKAKRKVSLQTRDAKGRWRTLESRRTKADGSFAFPTPTWNRTHPLRVRAAAAGKVKVGTSKVVKLKRTIPATTGGSAKAWTPLFDGMVARWNPCAPITVRADKTNAPSWFVKELKSVLAENSLYTGLTFDFEGTGARKDSDIYVQWRTAKKIPSLAGDTSGVTRTGVTRQGELVTARISLDLADYFYGRTFWRSVMRHELAHAVGLDHVKDSKQRMYAYTIVDAPNAKRWSKTWGAGDVAGLKRVGATYGCIG